MQRDRRPAARAAPGATRRRCDVTASEYEQTPVQRSAKTAIRLWNGSRPASGVSDIALKYLTEALHRGWRGIVSEWTLAALVASVLAFYASARALQLAPGVAVIAFTSVAANLAAIMGGILVFRDPIGIGAPAIVGRVIAFGLVIAGAGLMPAPLRASAAPAS
jgi:hypothetical protein